MTACVQSSSRCAGGMPCAMVSQTFTPSARFRTVEKPSSMTARGMVATRRDWPKKALFASQHLAGERLVVLDEDDELARAGILSLDEPEDLREHGRDGGLVLAADHLGAEPLEPPPVERSLRPRIRCSVTHARPPAFGLSA